MDNAAIEEIFETLGPIKIRRMFGGKGIYFDGIILALEVNGEILLRGMPNRRRRSRKQAPGSGPMKARASR